MTVEDDAKTLLEEKRSVQKLFRAVISKEKYKDISFLKKSEFETHLVEKLSFSPMEVEEELGSVVIAC